MSDLIQPNRQILTSGIQNHRPATNLYEYSAWLKKDAIQWPEQDRSNVVIGRICAGSWQEALPLVLERLKAICEQNKLPEDSFDLSYLAVKEINLPLT